MRRSFTAVALLAAFAAAACTDTTPTGTRLRPDAGGPLLQESVSDYVDRLVVDLFPKGLETATGSRWETVKQKLAADDFDGATKHLRDVAKYVKLKTPDITLTSEFKSKEHAAASLVYSMALYVYRPEITTPPTTGGDVAFEVVPAGEAATIVTPSEHAALDIPAGSTNEDRLITIIQDPNLWPGHCNGPLPTKLCQYPLFYDIASFPSIAFNNVVGVAVCAVTRTATADDRGPLDRPGEQTVHHGLRLARPFTGGPTTPRGTLHPETNPTIEILPLRENQRSDPLTDCSDIPTPVASLTPRGGWLGRAERGMLAVANFAAWVLTPKDLYAFDSGPEHETIGLGSPINAVDPESQPDLSVASVSAPSDGFGGDAVSVTYSVENRSRRLGGEATAASDPTTAAIYLFADAALTEQVAGPLAASEAIAGIRPDGAPQTVTQLVPLPTDITLDKQYYIGSRVTPNSGLPEVGDPTNLNNARGVPIFIRRRQNIAIYKNYNAWFGENKDESVLQAAPFNFVAGTDYVVRPMSELQAGIPAATSLIIITSASRGGNFENQISEQQAGFANLDAWVRGGGWLVIHAGDNAFGDGYIVPGLSGSGKTDDQHGCSGGTLTVADHAFIRGPDATLGTGDDLTDDLIDSGRRFGFCSDNHGSLADLLPANADVLMREQELPQRPVYATYALGSGRVIVTTLTIEFSLHERQTLINHFYWAINGLNAPPVASKALASSLTPSLNASGEDEVKVNTDGSPRQPPQ